MAWPELPAGGSAAALAVWRSRDIRPTVMPADKETRERPCAGWKRVPAGAGQCLFYNTRKWTVPGLMKAMASVSVSTAVMARLGASWVRNTMDT